MKLICEQLEAIEEILSGMANGIRVIRAYPAREMPRPLTRPIISFDVKETQGDGGFFGDLLCEEQERLLTGRGFKANLCITVHTPLKDGGGRCREVMDAALERLLKAGKIGAFRCGELKTAKERGAYVLSACAFLHGAAVTGVCGDIRVRSVEVLMSPSGKSGSGGEDICRELSVYLNAGAAEGIVFPQSALRLAHAFLQEKKENGEILSFRPPRISQTGEGNFEITVDFTEPEKKRLNIAVRREEIL